MDGVIEGSPFILLHAARQLSQHHLLNGVDTLPKEQSTISIWVYF
jgi:hypothetical protein